MSRTPHLDNRPRYFLVEVSEEYWRKGDTSGTCPICEVFRAGLHGDAILIEVDQVGAACHTGKRSCFEEGGQLPVVVGYRTKEQEGQR